MRAYDCILVVCNQRGVYRRAQSKKVRATRSEEGSATCGNRTLVEALISGCRPRRPWLLRTPYLTITLMASSHIISRRCEIVGTVEQLYSVQIPAITVHSANTTTISILPFISSWTQRQSFNSRWRCAGNHKISNETKIPIR